MRRTAALVILPALATACPRAPGTGAAVRGCTAEFPCRSTCSAGGTFDRIVPCLHESTNHLSRGVLPPGIDLPPRFDVREPPRNF